MLLDRGQKALIVRYMVVKRWYPLIEVDVIPPINTSAGGNKPVTDVDVLGLLPDQFQGFRRLLVDCKTRKSESPIARTLWLAGLMKCVGAEQGICILKKANVETDHRYYAAKYGVLLLAEADFANYARGTGVRDDAPHGRVGQLRYWERFYSLRQSDSNIAPGIDFLRQGNLQTGDGSESARKIIVALSRLSTELDPAKATHLAVFGQFVALFCIALASLTHSIFSGYLLPEKRDQLEAALLLLMYGGKDSYNYRNSLSKLYHELQRPEKAPPELRLPAWDSFVQLVRQCLDAPSAVSHAPLLMTEVSWTYLQRNDDDSGLSTRGGSQDFAKTLSVESPYAAKFAILAAEYLRKAVKLPKEFDEAITQKLLAIL